MRASRVAASLLLLLAAILAGPTILTAQSDDESTDRTLRGRVVDGEGRPVAMALVGLVASNQAVMADSLGRFALPVPTISRYRVAAEQLGYESAEVEVLADEVERRLEIVMARNPVVLEGLRVTVDRFERRRNFFTGSVRVLDQERIRRTAAFDTWDLVRRNTLAVHTCPSDSFQACVMRRGRRVQMTFCLDERPVFGGFTELEMYSPEEIYLVEIYDRGRVVRVYTRHFVDRLAKRPRALIPVSFGC